MFKRLFTDIWISAFILVMIWSAYFMTAQRILDQADSWFRLCGQVDVLQESLDKLELRKWLVEIKSLPNDTKVALIEWYNDQIALFQKKISSCANNF